MNTPVAIFDVDKTMFPGYSILDFALYLKGESRFNPGEWEEFQRLITEYKSGGLGYNEFAVLIVDSYARGLAGNNIEEINMMSQTFWNERVMSVYGYVVPLMQNLRDLNVGIVVISGSPIESLLPMFRKFDIMHYYTTEIDTKNGKFLSKVKINTASHEGKLEIVRKIFEEVDSNTTTYGFGYSVADLSFLELTNKSYVIGDHDKDLVEVARREGWRMLHDPNNERIEV